MNRFVQWFFGLSITGLLVGGPVAYGLWIKANIRNFHQVRDGVLYRSGQLSLFGLKNVIHDHGIKMVVTLRDAVYLGDPPPDLAEEEFCRDQEINYVRIPPRSWWAPQGEVPADEGIRQFLKVMDNPDNYPVLIHCFGGIHRAGAFTAIYRMEYEHWTNAEAMEEMKHCGYTTLDDEWDISTYLEKYRPRWQHSLAQETEDRGSKIQDRKASLPPSSILHLLSSPTLPRLSPLGARPSPAASVDK